MKNKINESDGLAILLAVVLVILIVGISWVITSFLLFWAMSLIIPITLAQSFGAVAVISIIGALFR